MGGMSSAGWKTLVVVGVLALGIDLVRPADVAAQTPIVKTKLNYINSNGAIGVYTIMTGFLMHGRSGHVFLFH